MKKVKRVLRVIDTSIPLWNRDLLPVVFSFLKIEELANLRICCRMFKDIVRDYVVFYGIFLYYSESKFPSFGDYRFEKVFIDKIEYLHDFSKHIERQKYVLKYLYLSPFKESDVKFLTALDQNKLKGISIQCDEMKDFKWMEVIFSKNKIEFLEFGTITKIELKNVKNYNFLRKVLAQTESSISIFQVNHPGLILNIIPYELYGLYSGTDLILEDISSAEVMCEILSNVKNNNSLKVLSLVTPSLDLCSFDEYSVCLAKCVQENKSLDDVVLKDVGGCSSKDLKTFISEIGVRGNVHSIVFIDFEMTLNHLIGLTNLFFKKNNSRDFCLFFRNVKLVESEGDDEDDEVSDKVFILAHFVQTILKKPKISFQFSKKEFIGKMIQVLEKHKIFVPTKPKEGEKECDCCCKSCNSHLLELDYNALFGKVEEFFVNSS